MPVSRSNKAVKPSGLRSYASRVDCCSAPPCRFWVGRGHPSNDWIRGVSAGVLMSSIAVAAYCKMLQAHNTWLLTVMN